MGATSIWERAARRAYVEELRAGLVDGYVDTRWGTVKLPRGSVSVIFTFPLGRHRQRTVVRDGDRTYWFFGFRGVVLHARWTRPRIVRRGSNLIGGKS